MGRLLQKLVSLIQRPRQPEPPSSSAAFIAETEQTSTEYQKPNTISEAYNNPRYNNKIVIESPEGLFSTTSGDKAVETFRKLQEKYPETPPVLTVIPKGTLLTTTTEPLAPSTKPGLEEVEE